jgi:hypothetical protein
VLEMRGDWPFLLPAISPVQFCDDEANDLVIECDGIIDDNGRGLGAG